MELQALTLEGQPSPATAAKLKQQQAKTRDITHASSRNTSSFSGNLNGEFNEAELAALYSVASRPQFGKQTKKNAESAEKFKQALPTKGRPQSSNVNQQHLLMKRGSFKVTACSCLPA